MEKQGLRPFQQTLVDLMRKPADDRSFYILYDPKGNAGKTSLLQYLHYHDIAFDLQPYGSVKEMMQYAYGFTHKKGTSSISQRLLMALTSGRSMSLP